MDHTSFLGSVATAYADKNGGKEDLSEFCFVFPNRRSGTFFLKYLAEASGGRTRLAPEVLTVGEFMSRVSGLDVAPRVIQLFELYLAYRSHVAGGKDNPEEDMFLEFDKFLPWGEIVLNDFSEVDMYNVDAHQIFSNVADYRSISSNFLTDEQKEVIDRYFGYRPDHASVQEFWKSFEGPDSKGLKEKYRLLWQMLPELYDSLRERLEHPEKGYPMCMAGSGYRIAMERVKEEGIGALPWKKVVVVGVEWLSTTEAELFRALSKEHDDNGEATIEFFWDVTGPVLTEKREPASAAIRRHRNKLFPEPEWARPYMAASERRGFPEMEEIAVPSNAMQAKVAGEWVRNLIRPENVEMIDNARVAVVLPDENLLLPLLHSLPLTTGPGDTGAEKKTSSVDVDNKLLRNVNLTMGWSMRYTSTASFVHHLQRLHSRRRTTGGKCSYLTSDLRLFLAQPLVQMAVESRVVMEINSFINRRHRRTMTYDELRGFSNALGIFLHPIGHDSPLQESSAWIEEVLLYVDSLLAEGRQEDSGEISNGIKRRVERMQLQLYLSALAQIVNAAERLGIGMRFHTLFHLLNKLTAGEKINFEGEPLAGLQVMGLMETRALDFDKVLVLSMNDKIMPRRNRKRTFIPDALRRGYGLPLALNDENRHAYWFYRLLSRAGEAVMVYDSRVGEGMRSGGRSRFLMQIDKLHARGLMRHVKQNFVLGGEVQNRVDMKKTDSVVRRLEEFKPGGSNALSATALTTYLECPLKFYYRFVLRYSDDPLPSGFIDALSQGNIFHDVMMRLYFSEGERNRFLLEGKVLSADDIKGMMEDESRLWDIMRESILRAQQGLRVDEQPEARPLTKSEEMVAARLLRQVRGVLEYDLNNAPVKLMGGEVKIREEWPVNDSLTVNLRGSVDRVDIDPATGTLRVVDFKTGSVHVNLKTLDTLFAGDYKSRNMLQLLLYAHMMEKQSREHGLAVDKVGMCIFDTNGMEFGGSPTYPSYDDKGSKLIFSQKEEIVRDFMPRLKETVAEIFDVERSFTPAVDPESCRGCVMAGICTHPAH